VFVFFVGVVSSDYLPMAHFVEDVDKLFDSFNSVKRGAAGNHCVAHLVTAVPI